MTDYSRRALVGDIGGTSIRFAITDIDELTIENFALLNSADFSGPAEALDRYLGSVPSPPAMVALAVAGPVLGDAARLTNLPWSFSADEIRRVTGARSVHFVNDFEALALVLPHLTDYDLLPLAGGGAVPGGTRLVLGPGTGLGVAALVPAGDEVVPVAGEGGHVAFAAQTREEFALIEQLGVSGTYASAEQVLCGAGLVALYRAVAQQAGEEPATLNPQRVVRAALSGSDAAALTALETYAGWLGRFAGDMALVFGARGGVYLGGGIAPNMLPVLTSGRFRQAFEGRGRMSAYLADIPISVIKVGADAGLRGAAVALARALPPVAGPVRRFAAGTAQA